MQAVGEHSEEHILKEINEAFDAKARTAGSIHNADKVAQAFGYSLEELLSVPGESNMGLSCGNPTAVANIREGEVVLDLGSGGGLDVLLAASKVGPGGQVIGLDISTDMISLARRIASKQDLRPPHVAFVQASLAETLPIESESVDCIISNCVINLLPSAGKAGIFKECYRVLKKGGRIVIDDILAKKPLPDEIRQDLASYVACISGAVTRTEYERLLAEAGFLDVIIVKSPGTFSAYQQISDCGSEPSRCCKPELTPFQTITFDPDTWVESCHIYAIKSGMPSADSPSPLLRWWDAYPTVQSKPPVLPADEVATLLHDSSKGDTDFAVIDVRRTDYSGYCVRGSHQWPAQTFFDDLPTFYGEFNHTKKVIFYCGSSSGRGPRCAGWYQDYLDSQGCTESRAFVLEGGIKGWVAKFGNDTLLVEKIESLRKPVEPA